MVSTSFIVAALSTLPLAFAYYPAANGTSTYPPLPSGTGAGKPAHTVAVGQNGLTFTPDTVQAKVGEDVVFQFFPKNHSVVQADFNNPCNPSEGGIFSGFNFNVSEGAAVSFPTSISLESLLTHFCRNKPSLSPSPTRSPSGSTARRTSPSPTAPPAWSLSSTLPQKAPTPLMPSSSLPRRLTHRLPRLPAPAADRSRLPALPEHPARPTTRAVHQPTLLLSRRVRRLRLRSAVRLVSSPSLLGSSCNQTWRALMGGRSDHCVTLDIIGWS